MVTRPSVASSVTESEGGARWRSEVLRNVIFVGLTTMDSDLLKVVSKGEQKQIMAFIDQKIMTLRGCGDGYLLHMYSLMPLFNVRLRVG